MQFWNIGQSVRPGPRSEAGFASSNDWSVCFIYQNALFCLDMIYRWEENNRDIGRTKKQNRLSLFENR